MTTHRLAQVIQWTGKGKWDSRLQAFNAHHRDSTTFLTSSPWALRTRP